VRLRADPIRLAQVFDIVLDNALKYTPDGGSIDVHLEAAAEEVHVRVDDEGIGIPESDLPLVGRPYFRAGNASTRRYSGMGLGLAIAFDIVRAHGGRISVAPRTPHGTSVRIALRAEVAS
jgi:signal transduction histidine kinase